MYIYIYLCIYVYQCISMYITHGDISHGSQQTVPTTSLQPKRHRKTWSWDQPPEQSTVPMAK